MRVQCRPTQAAIIGDGNSTLEAEKVAEQVGAMLARLGITVVTGGHDGVMEGASRGATQAGGLAVGIIRSGDFKKANPWCGVVIPTDIGHARNVLTVLSGDFVVAIGGGAGTLSEICFAWIHNRPLLVLQGFGGWSDRLDGAPLDNRRTSIVRLCSSIEELESSVVELCAELGLQNAHAHAI